MKKKLKEEKTKAGARNKTLNNFSYLPFPIHVINWIGEIIKRLGIKVEDRTEDSLMAAACRRTGLSDWGDLSFREPLEILLKSYRKDANLSLFGWMNIHQMLIRRLSNRLRIQDELKRHPDILKEQIRKPLFIASLPRTGTTFLYNLLSLDSKNRPLLYWETTCPVPPPEPHTRRTDPRIKNAKRGLKNWRKLAPDFVAIYPQFPEGPEECAPLLMNNFMVHSFREEKVPQYIQWLDDQDMVPAYQYYLKQLQILQFKFPTNRWLLKAPIHMYSLNALLAVFPDACVIQTHRDPLKVLPSTCSLIASLRSINSSDVDLKLVGKENLEALERMLDCSERARNSVDESRFFNIRYKDLVKDAIGTIHALYDHFGYPFEKSFEESMRKWLHDNPKNKHGVHRYSLEQFGLNKEVVNEKFSRYCKQYQISPDQ